VFLSIKECGDPAMKKNGQSLIPYNLRKALLYLQRAKMIASQSGDIETSRSISVSILQISIKIRKLKSEDEK